MRCVAEIRSFRLLQLFHRSNGAETSASNRRAELDAAAKPTIAKRRAKVATRHTAAGFKVGRYKRKSSNFRRRKKNNKQAVFRELLESFSAPVVATVVRPAKIELEDEPPMTECAVASQPREIVVEVVVNGASKQEAMTRDVQSRESVRSVRLRQIVFVRRAYDKLQNALCHSRN